MRCSTYLHKSCNKELWNARVNPNVKRGLLRVMANAKNTKRGKQNTNVNLIQSEKGEKKNVTSENPTLLKDAGEKLHKHCLRCGRKLKNVDNQLLGYGPVCYAKIQQENMYKKLF